ncbi:MAG: hypothetical protein QF570_16090 [Myxococcota bacterium]|jgi:hypothetical protein|nr:hypothetical protein [Myxococcota bacterium]
MNERSPSSDAADAVDANASAGAEGAPSVETDRTRQFRVTYIAVVLFVFLYLFTVQVFETYLQLYFDEIVHEAVDVQASPQHPGLEIRLNLIQTIGLDRWVDFWEVDVDVRVLAADQSTWLYVAGRAQVPYDPERDPVLRSARHRELLPALEEVDVNVDHNTMLSNTILIVYATILFSTLFFYNRRIVLREEALLDDARASRDRAATRAHEIESEIATVRAQLREVEPAKQEDREEISRLQREQNELQERLDALAVREQALRAEADRAAILEEDGRALEELLEEASEDLGTKNAEIEELEKNLKKVSKIAGVSGGKSKESDLLGRRMKVLYPRLDIDARAIDDIVALGDEGTKLRAEECLKRLDEEADNRGVRRKVGGLANYLSIYELGFAGKRRIYYAKVDKGRVRVLVVGAKNTQQNDLDYISRLPKSEFVEGLPRTSAGPKR